MKKLALPYILFLSKNPKIMKLFIGKGAVYEVLLEHMNPVRLANVTFPNATTVKTIIKELLHFRSQNWFQTKLNTYDSFATNKNNKKLIYLFAELVFCLYFQQGYVMNTYVHYRKLYKRLMLQQKATKNSWEVSPFHASKFQRENGFVTRRRHTSSIAAKAKGAKEVHRYCTYGIGYWLY